MNRHTGISPRWSALVFGLMLLATGPIALSAQPPGDDAIHALEPPDPDHRIVDKGVVRWYLEGAKQGYASSQYQLGKMYAAGEGVVEDYAQALHWYTLAAMQDYPAAQYSLAELYQHGFGVEMNYVTAYVWYHVAAMNKLPAGGLARDRLRLLMDAEQVSLAHFRVKKLWKKIAAAQQQAGAPLLLD